MTLIQLEYIVAVANYGSFSTAAEHCFVTQPTLSMQIQKLEDELGVKIFDRTKHPIAITETGEKVINQAKVILQESSRLHNDVGIENGIYAGRIRIGIIPTIAPYLLPIFLKEFLSRYPEVEVIVNEIITDEIINSLNRDLIDVGIVALPIHRPGIEQETLYYEPFVGYIPEDNILYGKKSLIVDDLNVDELLLLEEGHCFRDQALKICSSSERDISHKTNKVLFESGNLDTLKKLVEQNFGITLLPYLAVRYITSSENKKLVHNFSPPVPKREIGIVYNKNVAKRGLLKILKSVISDTIPQELKHKDNSLIVH
jgi:LysR family hydrogen peroxide-inducible transcriptional activator